MLSRLLVATDGSEASHRMLECVRQLSAIGAQEVLLVHVFNVRDVRGL
jgi:nucleotide-binding universal stress UspA family protein